MRKLLLIVIVSATMLTQVKAGPLEDLNAQMQKQEDERHQHPPPGAQATTMTPITQGLSDLLNAGWTIVAGSPSGIILRLNSKWISCQYDDGKFSGTQPGSRCVTLN